MERRQYLTFVMTAASGVLVGCLGDEDGSADNSNDTEDEEPDTSGNNTNGDPGDDNGAEVSEDICPPTTLEEAERVLAEPEGFTLLSTDSGRTIHSTESDDSITTEELEAYYRGQDGGLYLVQIELWPDEGTVPEPSSAGLVTQYEGETHYFKKEIQLYNQSIRVRVSGTEDVPTDHIEALYAATGCFEESDIFRRTWE